MLEVIADVRNLRLASGEPNKQRLAAEVGISPTTVRKIFDREGRQPYGRTLDRIEQAHRQAIREQAGYERQSAEAKRQRMRGAIEAMSEAGVESLYALVMGRLRQDLEAEFAGVGGEVADAARARETALTALARTRQAEAGGHTPASAG
ncbi:MAG: hypothetical protein ACLFV3_09245 [Phycisphaeraceae bacterium]